MHKICISKHSLIISIFLIFILSSFLFLSSSLLKTKTSTNSRAATNNTSTKPIIGGTEVSDPKKWPFVVRLFRKQDISTYSFCDGVRIAPQWIITAGHCVKQLEGEIKKDILFAGVGAEALKEGVEEIAIDYVVKHKDFREVTFTNHLFNHHLNDIALLHLSKMPSSLNSQVIGLHDGSTLYIREGLQSVALGWGLIEGYVRPSSLHQIVLPILSNARVNQLNWYDNSVSDREIAIGFPSVRAGTCKGDSGGPLIAWNGFKWLLIGIVSWGDNSGGCATPFKPSIFTRLDHNNGKTYISWISESMLQFNGDKLANIGNYSGTPLTPEEINVNDYEKRICDKDIWKGKEGDNITYRPLYYCQSLHGR